MIKQMKQNFDVICVCLKNKSIRVIESAYLILQAMNHSLFLLNKLEIKVQRIFSRRNRKDDYISLDDL